MAILRVIRGQNWIKLGRWQADTRRCPVAHLDSNGRLASFKKLKCDKLGRIVPGHSKRFPETHLDFGHLGTENI